jgi:hypothetical protein
MQTPKEHVSLVVQRLPSEHGTPFGLGAVEHCALPLQIAKRHWSKGAGQTDSGGTQTPREQTPVDGHSLPGNEIKGHELPSVFGKISSRPVAGLQMID